MANSALVCCLQLVVELVAHSVAQLVDKTLCVEPFQHERGAEAVERFGVVEVAVDGLGHARVLHLHRDVAPVARDGAVHLTDAGRGDGHGLPVEEDPFGWLPELVGHHLGGQCRRHRCGVGLQRGQRLLGVVGQRLHDEAQQLAELHQRALHVAQFAGDVLRRADGEPLVHLVALLAAVAHATQTVDEVAAPVARRQSPHASRAAPANQPAHASRRAVGLAASRSCGNGGAGDLVGPVCAGIETGQGDLDVGEIPLDRVEVEGHGSAASLIDPAS